MLKTFEMYECDKDGRIVLFAFNKSGTKNGTVGAAASGIELYGPGEGLSLMGRLLVLDTVDMVSKMKGVFSCSESYYAYIRTGSMDGGKTFPAEKAWTLVANDDGLFVDRMGQSARELFAIQRSWKI